MSVSFALGFGACSDGPRFVADARCPNEHPAAGARCEPGLSCNYAEPTNCAPYFTATCTADGTWELDRPCATGGGGAGNEGGEGNSGNLGGSGGEGGCDDPIAGAPEVTSEVNVVYAPDRGTGFYPLTFTESVTGVGPELTWTGPGSIVGVSKVGSVYRVFYTGLSAGDSATLTVDGAVDGCGNPMAAPVDVNLNLLPSCHLFEESFEENFLDAGWTTDDLAGDGHVWARSDERDVPTGVPNHTEGAGLCATTNDIDSLPGSSWDTELVSPPIDLSGLTNVVLRFQHDLHDAVGAGSAVVEASSDGSSWSTVKSYSDDASGLAVLDLSAFAGDVVYLRFRYANDGGLSAWWDLDDVCVERFTQSSCPCLAGGVTEIKDVEGALNGNGDVFTAELSGGVLTQVGDRMIACGKLEQSSLSGADYFRFTLGSVAGPLQARVSYCVENALQPAHSGVWLKSEPSPLAQVTDITSEGTYEVTLSPGLEHFVSLGTDASPYTKSRYRLIVEVTGTSTPLLAEGFEVWPPLSFSVTDDDPCANWLQSSQTVVPSGGLPTQGNALAYFNSYDCPSGSESLESGPLSFSGLSNVVLSLDMFHDPGFSGANDTIQVEYRTGATWIPIGDPLLRPGPTAAWDNHMIDLSSLAGLSSVRIRLRATSAYGNHTHIDNVLLLSN